MSVNHQLEIVIEPDLVFIEQEGKVITIAYKDGHGFILTFKNEGEASSCFNDNENHEAGFVFLATGLSKVETVAEGLL